MTISVTFSKESQVWNGIFGTLLPFWLCWYKTEYSYLYMQTHIAVDLANLLIHHISLFPLHARFYKTVFTLSDLCRKGDHPASYFCTFNA